jgi:GT2 family glycosyltransferase
VVLSYKNEDTVIHAVDSLLEQGVPLEIVVSHSGGGPTPELLARTRPSVRVVASDLRRLPGAARNAGVAATSAPYVSFLAGDCVALPGWAEGRLRRHLGGAVAVASTLTPAEPGLIPLAAHLLQNSFRLAGIEVSPLLWSGLSYARELLERHGPFPDALSFGEDIAFNDRLFDAGVEVVLAPEVVAAHHYPVSAWGLVSDQFRRGRQRGSIERGPLRRLPLLAGAMLTPGLAIRRAGRRPSTIAAAKLAAATPLLLLGSMATAAGTIVGDRSTPRSSPELASLRRRMWLRRTLAAAATYSRRRP